MAHGAWEHRTAGMPLLEEFSGKALGSGETKLNVIQDRLGRLFVASNDKLQVFDGQDWRTFPIGSSYGLRALAFGADGIIWAAANNEAGYFKEESLGNFQYHSLLSHLPSEDRLVGDAWGCAVIGSVTYYIFRDRVLRWDGQTMQVQIFAGNGRLFPIRFGTENWFHHLGTGLYRLTENGPRLEYPREALPEAGILGLARIDGGLVVASGIGLYRPGTPPVRLSDDVLSDHMKEHRLAIFTPLDDGKFVITTLTGGVVLTDKSGRILRVFDPTDGFPSRITNTMSPDHNGYLWCAAPTGIFNWEAAGRVTVFNSLNGLNGRINGLVRPADGALWAFGTEGTFRLRSTPGDGGHFEKITPLTAAYNHVLSVPGGMLLSKHGGIDFFNGTELKTIVKLEGSGCYRIIPVRQHPGIYYVLEIGGLHRLSARPDGTWEHAFLAKPADFIVTAQEDERGRLWVGTIGQGAFTFDPQGKEFVPVTHPATGRPLTGMVSVIATNDAILLLNREGSLRCGLDGTGLRALSGMPSVDPLYAAHFGAHNETAIVFKHSTSPENARERIGVLGKEKGDNYSWRELDVPGGSAIGSINALEFTQEDGQPILWLGGSTGLLRLDYDAIPTQKPPASPVIELDQVNSGRTDAESVNFPFKNHRLRFHVFTGEYTRSRDWLVQTRLGDAAWSTPSTRRSFEFTNLSEGDYRFEARTINPAGMTSEPFGFAFRILPPWYRSTWAYAGYSVMLFVGVMGFIRIRERRIRARNEELEGLVNVRTAELVKANAAKDEFLAGISHEIRNPMNGVIGIAENFRTDSLDPESRRKFGLLRQCATHLSSLLEDILDFSKVQAGAIELDPKPFDLPELVESVAGITRADSEKYGIPVEIAVSPAVPRTLVGDARRIRQILINFVSNALKFSDRGQVSVTVWCKDAGPGRSEVVFAISDEGPGISPEEQARLFTRFERGAAAQKGRVPGTGLGLALCKGLAEKMGGKLWLESELGRGSCFYFSAPFPVVAPAEPAAAPATAVAGRSALVVDDQEYNRIVLSDLLQAMGFNVHLAQEGQAALDAATRRAFDVVFLDFNLPGMSGVDVARGIRTLPGPSAHALILATTAFTTPEKRAQCLDAGMDAFLGKPVTRERLIKALAALPSPVQPAAPAASVSVAPPKAPADPLGNLRLIARKKGVPLTQELATYFDDLDAELAQLNAALAAENADDAGRFSHMLCGRCSFIYERELEQAQRRVEAAIADLQWSDARRHRDDFARQLAAVRVRLASSGPAAPRA